MFRKRCAMMAVMLGIAGVTLVWQGPATAKPASPTFNKDVLPILQKNCQVCHRPGEIGPMSFLTYEEVRPWAKGIKAAVLKRQMPPWFADPGYGHFANDRRLTDVQIQTISAWADGGAPEGEAKDKPAAVTFQDGWNIKPDMIIEMPEAFEVPASGTVAYQNFLVKVNFPEDRWVIAAEMRPGDSRVVHHMRANVRPPTSTFMKDAIPGKPYETSSMVMMEKTDFSDVLGKFNPGLGAQNFSLFESAKFVPKGSDIVFNVHYTTVGKPVKDKSRVGIVFAKKPPKLRYFMNNGPTAKNLAIPAGADHAEVVSEMTTKVPMKLAYVQPHMHLRGKDYELRIVYPSGKSEVVFKAKWDFNWQIGYDLAKPLDLPVGTRIIGVAHFDNSANNKFNPDPLKLVTWGDQNWEEMQNCFIGVLIDPKFDPQALFTDSGPSLLPRGPSGPTLAALVVNK